MVKNMSEFERIFVNAGHGYEVVIGENLLESCGELIRGLTSAQKAAIVTDDNVDLLYADNVEKILKNAGFDVVKFVFAHGEQSKSIAVLSELYNFLASNDITRSDILVALGGGVVGDLTGFAAASFLRGIEYVQVPTTLLAQVDSSVGGKTAVDIAAGKNLVGAFKQPLVVIADITTLDTLSDDFFIDGMGEVVKYAMIRSSSLFTKIFDGNVKGKLPEIISECVKIKRDVVGNDEFDKGERMILNFGHTLGHAIEKYYHFSGLSHGKAVAVGMALICRFAVEKGIFSAEEYQRLNQCLTNNALPCETKIDVEKLYELSLNDKKRNSDKINIIVCPEIGKCEIKKMNLDEYRDFCCIGKEI